MRRLRYYTVGSCGQRAALVMMAAALLVTGCGKKKEDEKAGQAAATDTEGQETDSAAERQNGDGLPETDDEKEASAQEQETEAPGQTDEEFYKETLNRIYEYIVLRDDSEMEAGYTGLWEKVSGGQGLSELGYAFLDLNHDGNNELLIGSVSDRKPGNASTAEAEGAYEEVYVIPGEILMAYTPVNNQPVQFLSGWARNSYYRLPDEQLWYEASAGFDYSMAAVVTLPEVSNQQAEAGIPELNYQDCWFTAEDEADSAVVYVYHNQDGSWDPETSEKTQMSTENFRQLEEEYEAQTLEIDYIPFADYSYSGEKDCGREAALNAGRVFLQEEPGAEENDDSDRVIILDPAENGGAEVIFEAEETVTDVRLLKLSLMNTEDPENITYEAETVYSKEQLVPGQPLLVRMLLPEIIPIYAIAYCTEDGKEIVNAVNLSGEDGSVFLTEIELAE